MFMVGCQGDRLSESERLIFAEYQFGGYILFKRNCADPPGIARLCANLWTLAADTPPFIAIDQEGGRVHRLPPPFTHLPAAAQIGAQRDPQLARRLGLAAANELNLIGVNLNFAPVLDVDSNPANPVIGDRAFGADPQLVIEIASAWADGLRQDGIIPCGKHFPGHGDTDKDSHIDFPTVQKSFDELQRIELPPFVHASAQHLECLMTAHVLYHALDPLLPATLSQPIITDLLRHQLGFDGVVFSDDMEMQAISGRYGIEETTLRAVQAGVDILLYCHAIDKAITAFELLLNEAERDPFVRARVDASHRRIGALKRRCLEGFTGVGENEIVARLRRASHGSL
jgi:beta-N-acetylhexosaminidase